MQNKEQLSKNVNLASIRKYNNIIVMILRNYMGIYKVLLLLNEHGEPSFLFQNLSSYKIDNQYVKFDKNLSAFLRNDLKCFTFL